MDSVIPKLDKYLIFRDTDPFVLVRGHARAEGYASVFDDLDGGLKHGLGE